MLYKVLQDDIQNIPGKLYANFQRTTFLPRWIVSEGAGEIVSLSGVLGSSLELQCVFWCFLLVCVLTEEAAAVESA